MMTAAPGDAFLNQTFRSKLARWDSPVEIRGTRRCITYAEVAIQRWLKCEKCRLVRNAEGMNALNALNAHPPQRKAET
jgi:hypothetical protein